MSIIEARNLCKTFKIAKNREGLKGNLLNLIKPEYEFKKAVNNINFKIGKGEMVGYIGENGAGKSTTIKMLTGILTPTSGEAIINGVVPYKNRVKNNMQIGVVFGQRTQLWWDTPVIESYKLIQKMYEVPIATYRKNLEMFTELLELEPLLSIPVRQLSLGQKMRCEIAASFLHNPKIVYLDEPTVGLDIFIKDKMREFVKTVNRENGVTVILTSHDLRDIEEICSRVIIIDKGSIAYDGSVDEIKNSLGAFRIIEFKVRNINKEFDAFVINNNYPFSLLSMDSYKIKIKFDGNKMTAANVWI